MIEVEEISVELASLTSTIRAHHWFRYIHRLIECLVFGIDRECGGALGAGFLHMLVDASKRLLDNTFRSRWFRDDPGSKRSGLMLSIFHNSVTRAFLDYEELFDFCVYMSDMYLVLEDFCFDSTEVLGQ